MIGKFFEIILIQPLFNLLILMVVWLPGHSLGGAIILLTILIRSLLIPSSAQALRQQHKLRAIQPELKKVQEQYKDDREAHAREMMAVYRKYDIHPLGSCLPMLIQLPILIALFYVIRDGIQMARFDLLYQFVPKPDVMSLSFFGIDLRQTGTLVLPILAALAQFLQSWLLIRDPRSHQAEGQMQKALNLQLLYFFPFMTGFIAYTLPAALGLYWFVSTLFTLIQQWWLFRSIPQPVSIASESTVLPPSAPSEKRGSVSVTVRKKK